MKEIVTALIALIPTLIVGLLSSPKTAPAGAWLQKAWNGFLWLLHFLSAATFKDQPGTFQMPLRGLGVPYLLRRSRGGSNTMIVLLLGVVASGPCLLAASCAWLKAEGKAVAADAFDCGQAAVQAEMTNLLPTVLVIVSGGAVDWQAQLAALEARGVEALACTLAKAADQLRAGAPRAASDDGGTRAVLYIVKRQWTFKQAR